MPVVVVQGPPVSGKSTYAQQRAARLRDEGHPDPIVVDWDLIAVALGSQQHHGHGEHLVPVVSRLRGLAVKAAIEAARDTGCWAIIVDTMPTEARLATYRKAGAEFVHLTATPEELHARASAERPPLWHQLIDDWAPTREAAGPSWQTNTVRKLWPKRPAHRKSVAGSRYAAMRRAFLSGKTNCENCGRAFVLDAPCAHAGCRRRGKGCYHHDLYPTVQHRLYLADGAPALDVSTWAAWCAGCNKRDGALYGHAKRAQAHTPGLGSEGSSVDLDW